MSFLISGLAVAPFQPLFALSDAELAAHGARRRIADAQPGYPCRVTLADAAVGESLILVHFEHQPAATPFRAGHAIYIRESARTTFDAVDQLPGMFATRLLSLRAFDAEHMMIDAEVIAGDDAATLIERMFANREVAYLHAHFARPGCYAARIDRA